MKFRAICFECYKKEKYDFFSKKENADLSYFDALNKYYFETGDRLEKDIYYETDVKETPGFVLTCKYGHESFVYLGIEVYEILFDRGIFAYSDQYYREAVVNFASSVERFHEYCIRLMLYACRVQLDDVNKTFKSLKYTERQYGAFVSLFVSLFKVSPPQIGRIKPNSEWSSFRNNVVHNGYFPTREETIQALSLTSKYIYEVTQYFEESGKPFDNDTLYHYKHSSLDKIVDNLVEEYKGANKNDPEKIKKVDLAAVDVTPSIRYFFDMIDLDKATETELHKYSEEQIDNIINDFIEDNKDAYKK